MAKIKAQGKKKHVQQALNIKSVAPVGGDELQVCWCKGFGVGCGEVRSERTRRRHATQQRNRRESD